MDRRFFHRLGASLLDRTICSTAGGEALAATYGGKIGMHVEHYAESKLILIWGSNSIASNLHFWTYAQAAKRNGAKLVCIDPRKTETADKCHQHIALLPGTDGALALGLMHELIVNDWLDRRLHRAPHQRLAGAARARTAVAARARRGRLRHHGRRGARPGAGLRHDAAGGDPPQLRHAARARRRQRGAAGGDPALPRRRLAPPRRRPAAVELGLVPDRAMPRCSGPTCWPGACRARSTWSRSATTCCAAREPLPTERFGPKIEAIVVYNSNPVAVAPESAEGRAGLRAARTCSPSCSSTS